MALIETTIFVTDLQHDVQIDVVYGVGKEKVPPQLRNISKRVEFAFKESYIEQLKANLEYRMPAVLVTVIDPASSGLEMPKLSR